MQESAHIVKNIKLATKRKIVFSSGARNCFIKHPIKETVVQMQSPKSSTFLFRGLKINLFKIRYKEKIKGINKILKKTTLFIQLHLPSHLKLLYYNHFYKYINF